MSTSEARPAEIRLGCGPRQVEEAVLDEVLLRLGEARSDPSLLENPLRVVVPSRSLREHLAARLVERAGAGLAGLTIQTLYGLALEVVERAGPSRPLAVSAMPILVRQAARDEPALHLRLEPLVDGYGVVRGAVDDLFDAGFEPLHAEAVIERLEAEPNGGPEIEVACAVVRVASRVATLKSSGASQYCCIVASTRRPRSSTTQRASTTTTCSVTCTRRGIILKFARWR